MGILNFIFRKMLVIKLIFGCIFFAVFAPPLSNAQSLNIVYDLNRPNSIGIEILDYDKNQKYQLELYHYDGKNIFNKKVSISFENADYKIAKLSEQQVLRLFWRSRPINRDLIKPEIKKVIDIYTNKKSSLENMRFFFVLSSFDGDIIDIKYVVGKYIVDRKDYSFANIKTRIYKPRNIETNENLPAIILLGGSGGGYASEVFAASLSFEGYLVASVAYFGIDGTPLCLANIEVTLLDKIIDVLKKHPDSNKQPVTLIGVSRGADYAVLFAKYKPEFIRSVILVAPDGYIFGSAGSGCEDTEFREPAWLINGKPISFIPPVRYNWLQRFLINFHTRRVGAVDQVFAKTLRFINLPEKVKNNAILPLGELDLPVLILKGGDDRLSRLRYDSVEFKVKNNVILYEYENAGHLIFSEIYTPFHNTRYTLINGKKFLAGGTDRANAEASYQVWLEILKFIKNNNEGEHGVANP